MQALPTVKDLAECPQKTLDKLWEGLGYYSRARNLQKAAQKVMAEYGGVLPSQVKELVKLPGIGPYTAGAIASISFGEPVPAVDGNVLRVASRLFLDTGDVTRPDVRSRLTKAIHAMQPPDRPGDYNQALMERWCACRAGRLCAKRALWHINARRWPRADRPRCL